MQPNGSSTDHFEQVIDLSRIEGDKQLINLGLDMMTDGQTVPPSAPLIAFEENANKGLPGRSHYIMTAYTQVLLLALPEVLHPNGSCINSKIVRTKMHSDYVFLFPLGPLWSRGHIT